MIDMKKLEIYEPAMCCSTGLCGVGVDPELLRISTVLDLLKKNEIEVERYNLSSAPQAFVSNQKVNLYIKDHGVEVLPVAVLDGEIIIEGRYPSNEEFTTLLDLPTNLISDPNTQEKESAEADDCCCSGGCCC
jgi:hypothetical protein